MRCAVIFNPTARGGRARRFVQALEAMQDGLTLKPTTGPRTAPDLAIQAAQEGCDVVVAAGGDGTVNEVVDGLARDPQRADRVRLGIIPLGTINVLARELHIPLRLSAAWEVIRAGRELRVDLPRVSFTRDGSPEERCFTQLAGAGLDSRAIDLVRWETKQRLGWMAYALAGLQALRGPHPDVVVRAGDRTARGPLVVIGNGNRYGGEVGMFPDASMTDGELDARIFRRVGFATLLRFGWAWALRRPIPPSDDVCLRSPEFTLASEAPLPFQLDGDNVGHLPARFTVQRKALRVLAPA
ncbi:MAG: diacylglycerol kinase family lipid kinase [Verrucomicrobiales bacterium]|nr:diacylglycerol kinase family lipid kinase [Verrucomicrobiales bacterium]